MLFVVILKPLGLTSNKIYKDFLIIPVFSNCLADREYLGRLLTPFQM